MELAPGQPLMSRDNLDSMKVSNVCSGNLPGLNALGISPRALSDIAPTYDRLNRLVEEDYDYTPVDSMASATARAISSLARL